MIYATDPLSVAVAVLVLIGVAVIGYARHRALRDDPHAFTTARRSNEEDDSR